MTKIKVDCIMGTRPEAIKMAPVVLKLKSDDRFSVRVIATGQHTDMLVQALAYFGLTADANLSIMKERQSLDHITSAVLQGVGALLDESPSDAVLVHGDTTTTFAAALAAFYRHIPVGHVEAGLRSFDLQKPFPEEMNRLLTDRISTWWFAPTKEAKENLLREGLGGEAVLVTGNTVVDALKHTVSESKNPTVSIFSDLADDEFLLLTAHRRESWGEPLHAICRAFKDILTRMPHLKGVVPMHRNPLVREIIQRELGDLSRVILCDPLDYPDFVWCMNHSKLILSDSGGVQEEATGLRRPVLILRDVTERPEAISEGSGVLVGTDERCIVDTALSLLSDNAKYEALVKKCDANPFGDGTAAEIIVDRLATDLLSWDVF